MKNRTMARKLERARLQARDAAAIECSCVSASARGGVKFQFVGSYQIASRASLKLGLHTERKGMHRSITSSAYWGTPAADKAPLRLGRQDRISTDITINHISLVFVKAAHGVGP
jgi:hypothetical protein